MRLILVRHGNTFETDMPAFYVGSQQDLPLVASGELQAAKLGQYFAKTYPELKAIYSGPLIRMQQTAGFILDAMPTHVSIQIDTRLNELDYGAWSGLTAHQVQERFGQDDFEQWENYSEWPKQGGWPETRAEVLSRIQQFSESLLRQHAENDEVMVVASNGCLRFFLSLIPGALDQAIANRQIKIATGHFCELNHAEGAWTLHSWNQSS